MKEISVSLRFFNLSALPHIGLLVTPLQPIVIFCKQYKRTFNLPTPSAIANNIDTYSALYSELQIAYYMMEGILS